MSWCFFPGSPIFKMIHGLGTVQTEVQQYLQKYSAEEGWLTEYNFRHNYSSPFRVNEGLEEYSRMTYLVTALIRQANLALTEVYDNYTVTEWIEQKIYPLYKDLSDFKTKADTLKMRNIWPRRPLPILKAVEDLLGTTTTTTQKSVKLMNQYNVGNHAGEPITVRPKRLVQQPDYYRHPPGS
jgi:hexosaminidase